MRLTVARVSDQRVFETRQLSPAPGLVQVGAAGQTRHAVQLQHVEHVTDRQHDDVHALDAGVDGERDGVLLVAVRVAVRDDDGDVGCVVPVPVTRREHLVLLRTKQRRVCMQ